MIIKYHSIFLCETIKRVEEHNIFSYIIIILFLIHQFFIMFLMYLLTLVIIKSMFLISKITLYDFINL